MEIICRKYNYPEFINVSCRSYCACSMTSYEMARSHRVESGVSAWYCYSPFLVNVCVCLFLYRLKTPQFNIVTRVLHFSCSHVTWDKFCFIK